MMNIAPKQEELEKKDQEKSKEETHKQQIEVMDKQLSQTEARHLDIVQILQLMEIAEQLLIAVYMDNMGAIFLASNQNTNNNDQMKHIDVHNSYHLIHEYGKTEWSKFNLWNQAKMMCIYS